MKKIRYYIFTLGCQMNQSDSQRLAAFLDGLGYKESKNENQANIIIINACSVRQKGIDRIFGKVRNYRLLKNKPKLILTGCILSKDRKKFEGKFDFIFKMGDFESLAKFLFKQVAYHPELDSEPAPNLFWGSDDAFRVPPAMPRHSRWRAGKPGMTGGSEYFGIIPKYQKNEYAYIPIMTGCDNFCSYCVVPYTRGRERSRPMEDILFEVQLLVKKGYKKIIILGQNVNSYKIQETRDKDTKKTKSDFVKLLEKINDLPGNFEIEFLTSHPKDMNDDLIMSFKNLKKLSPRLHIAMQSADNHILSVMNRKYSRAQFRGLVEKIREAQPGIFLSTDIIVGFPGETKKQFENTLNFCKKIKFDKAYVSMYSERAGTMAAKLVDNVSLEEKKRRWKTLDKLIND